MAITGLSHLGIAVRDWEGQLAFYRDVLGLPLLGVEEVADQGVRVAVFQAGLTRIELLGPTRDDCAVAKFLAKRGEGLHHLAYAVDDLEADLTALASRGVALVDPTPRPGAGGHRIAFLHPRSTFGVLTELTEEASAPLAPGAAGGKRSP